MSYPAFWLTIGFLGQALFTARFLVQWMASEKRRDAVIVVGQSMGLFIYVRNLMLIDKARRRLELRAVGGDPP